MFLLWHFEETIPYYVCFVLLLLGSYIYSLRSGTSCKIHAKDHLLCRAFIRPLRSKTRHCITNINMDAFWSVLKGVSVGVATIAAGPVALVAVGAAAVVAGTTAVVEKVASAASLLDPPPAQPQPSTTPPPSSPAPPPPPPRPELSDESWGLVWTNVEATLHDMAKSMCDYAKRSTATPLQADVDHYEEMCSKYEKAIQDGVENMSCGRIGIIGNGEPLELMTSLIAGKDVYTISNDKLCPVTEEAELGALGTIAIKVMKKKSTDLKCIVEAFSDKPAPNANTNIVDDKISNEPKNTNISKGIKDLVTEVKYRALAYASESSTSSTPALIYVTNHSEQLKHLLPILITSRSIFLVAMDKTDRTSDSNQDEDVCRSIAYINSSLSEKASTLFHKLHNKEGKSVPPYDCPYPKILIVGTCTSVEQRTRIQSRIDEVSKWIEKSCSDSAKQKCNAIVVNATTNQAVAEIEAQVAQFITRDLVIPTPLSWELFRQIFSYVTKKEISTLSIDQVALIARLCDITPDEFPSVLNFFHEHGALLYYANVEYLQNIVIIDPKWLQDELCKIFTPPPDQSSQPMWTRLLKQGILVAPLCEEMWQSEKVEGLPTGLAKLLEKYHLIAPIEIDKKICDFEGPKYFAPFALQSKRMPSLYPTFSELQTAPLHFTFPVTKYLPLGVFTYLTVALASKEDLKIDFENELFSDQVTFWYGNYNRDKVILSATLTSISVVVERMKCCGDEYETNNFWCTCQKVLSLVISEIEAVLKKTFPHVRANPCLECTCLPQLLPHYVSFNISATENTCNALRCAKRKEYTLQANDQWWLQMAAPSVKNRKLFEAEIDGLMQFLKPEDCVKLCEALEITDSKYGIDLKILISCWSEKAGPDARAHLMFHLRRLGLGEAAFRINKGILEDKKDAERELQCRGN